MRSTATEGSDYGPSINSSIHGSLHSARCVSLRTTFSQSRQILTELAMAQLTDSKYIFAWLCPVGMPYQKASIEEQITMRAAVERVFRDVRTSLSLSNSSPTETLCRRTFDVLERAASSLCREAGTTLHAFSLQRKTPSTRNNDDLKERLSLDSLG